MMCFIKLVDAYSASFVSSDFIELFADHLESVFPLTFRLWLESVQLLYHMVLFFLPFNTQQPQKCLRMERVKAVIPSRGSSNYQHGFCEKTSNNYLITRKQ